MAAHSDAQTLRHSGVDTLEGEARQRHTHRLTTTRAVLDSLPPVAVQTAHSWMSASDPCQSLRRCIQTHLDECRLQHAFDDESAPSVSNALEWPDAAVNATTKQGAAAAGSAAAAHASCHVIVQLANAFKAKLRAKSKEATATAVASTPMATDAAPATAAVVPTATAPPLGFADSFDLSNALARWGEILRAKLLADPAMGGWIIEPVVKGYLNFTRKPQQPAESSSSITAAAAASPASLPFAASTAASASALPPAPLSQASSFTFSSLGTWRSIFKEKHGTPRQGSVVPLARGSLTLHPSISPQALEGLQEYSHVWIVFVFHSNNSGSGSGTSIGGGASSSGPGSVSHQFASGKIKPPRLGGKRVGLFATRSPHRPNPIGLSLARLDRLECGVMFFSGIDLIEATPVIDIKPYHPADCQEHYKVPQWMSAAPERSLDVAWGAGTLAQLHQFVSSAQFGLEFYTRSESGVVQRLIESILEQDPRTLHSKEKHAEGGVYGICVDRIDVAFKIVQQPQSNRNEVTGGAEMMDVAAPSAVAAGSPSSSSAAPAPAPRLTALIFDLEYFAPGADRPRQRTKEWLERISAKTAASAQAAVDASGGATAASFAAAGSAASPPAARLVGIELNPGPPKRSAAAAAIGSAASPASSSAAAASSSASDPCVHAQLLTDPSAHAAEVGYVRPSLEERRAAAEMVVRETKSGQKGRGKGKRSRVDDDVTAASSSSSTAAPTPIPAAAIDPLRYPAPLCLPGDDLALDPQCPLQSLSEWVADGDRNEVSEARRTIYVVAPPKLERSYLREWSQPCVSAGVAASVNAGVIASPPISSVVSYLSAFYAGMTVKQLPALTFTAWDDDDDDYTVDAASSSSAAAAVPPQTASVSKAEAGPRYVSLRTATEGVRIRTRASPDGIYPRQLNLDNLLDAAIGMLPRDAYALLLLVDHDLYESKDDLFCCGRAYGGSRVAVISSARYHPALDSIQQVERNHAWPAAHCSEYLRAIVEEHQGQPQTTKSKKKAKTKHGADAATATATASADSTDASNSASAAPSPLSAAIVAHAALAPSAPSSSSSSSSSATASPDASFLSGLWLGRVCRTSAHELGHCFGIEHCTAYACAMQGSANLIEDARQPPYVCPIDEAKLTRATGSDASTRNRALLRFCEQHPHVQLFAAFAAWIRTASGAPPAVASS